MLQKTGLTTANQCLSRTEELTSASLRLFFGSSRLGPQNIRRPSHELSPLLLAAR